MPTALQLAKGNPQLEDAVRRGRKLLNKRALTAAAASAVPLPGLDWAVDAALLSKLIPEVNAEFGLTPAQIERLAPHKRDEIHKAVGVVGSLLVGKLVTRDLVIKALKMVGVRMTTKQAAKYVPFAGTAISALMGYTAIRYLGEEHLKDCVKVAQAVQLALPAPSPSPAPAKRRIALRRRT